MPALTGSPTPAPTRMVPGACRRTAEWGARAVALAGRSLTPAKALVARAPAVTRRTPRPEPAAPAVAGQAAAAWVPEGSAAAARALAAPAPTRGPTAMPATT